MALFGDVYVCSAEMRSGLIFNYGAILAFLRVCVGVCSSVSSITCTLSAAVIILRSHLALGPLL